MNAQPHHAFFDRAAALEVISDMSKDAYGFRVRKSYDGLPDSAIIDDMNYYAEVTRDSIRRERLQQEQARRDWDAHMAELMAIGAATLGDAIRWDMQALGANDVDYYLYLSDLPYSMEEFVKEALDG